MNAIAIPTLKLYLLYIVQAMEDALGDSAVIEHIGGSFQIYHDRDNTHVMTK